MNPVRVTPPEGMVISLADLKARLRVSGDDNDAELAALHDEAVSHLEGWRGALGRCILPQQWQVSVAAGKTLIPFPDITEATAVDSLGDPVDVTLTNDARGSFVEVDTAADVTFTVALPEDALPAARAAVVCYVKLHFDNMSGPDAVAMRAAFDAHVHLLRWVVL
jgi:hypothetical protein